MSTSEPKSPSDKPAEGKLSSSELRFRYIGFGIYSKRVPRFWKSEKEAAAYAGRVRLGSGVSSLDRDFSLLHVVPVSRADRAVITVVALLMVGTLMMPWVQFRTLAGNDLSLSWGGALGTLLGGLSTAFAGGLGVGLSAILGLVLLVGCPIVGLWTLASLWMKAKSDEAYQVRLKRPLYLGYALFFSGLGIAILSLFGGDIPGYASWGLINLGESYGIQTLAGLLSFGTYTALTMGLVAGVKSADL
jgi:hypothetical protein